MANSFRRRANNRFKYTGELSVGYSFDPPDDYDETFDVSEEKVRLPWFVLRYRKNRFLGVVCSSDDLPIVYSSEQSARQSAEARGGALVEQSYSAVRSDRLKFAVMESSGPINTMIFDGTLDQCRAKIANKMTAATSSGATAMRWVLVVAGGSSNRMDIVPVKTFRMFMEPKEQEVVSAFLTSGFPAIASLPPVRQRVPAEYRYSGLDAGPGEIKPFMITYDEMTDDDAAVAGAFNMNGLDRNKEDAERREKKQSEPPSFLEEPGRKLLID